MGAAWCAGSSKSGTKELEELRTVNHVGSQHRDVTLSKVVGCVLNKVHVLLVLLEEVLAPILEISILSGIVKVLHSKCKHLQLLLGHGRDCVALLSATRLADDCNSTLHGILVGHFGNVDCFVPSLPQQFDGCHNAGIAATFNGLGKMCSWTWSALQPA